MFRPIFAASVRAHSLLSRTPTNRLLTWLRQRHRLKLGVPFMLLGLAYWAVAVLVALWIQAGASSWLNLLVLLAFWNGAKFIVFGPWSLVLLTAARVREATAERSAQRANLDAAGDRTYAPRRC